ncbi:BC1872 family protein [Brevibacillus laterosporus]|uniref:BC1872 family protein n=1 Tax=Brevibacillus laterosporus TaxID=1465 RepID=UPI003D1A85B6
MTDQQIIVTLATKVMGWELLANDGLGWTCQRPDGVFVYEWSWNPLENLADAFQVMDKLFIALIPQAGNPPEDMKYLAVFDDSPIGPKIKVFAKTAQEAICKVAMEWVA